MPTDLPSKPKHDDDPKDPFVHDPHRLRRGDRAGTAFALAAALTAALTLHACNESERHACPAGQNNAGKTYTFFKKPCP